MEFPRSKAHIFYADGAWHVVGGSWDSHLAAYEHTLKLNGTS
jgi:hypothetical protein